MLRNIHFISPGPATPSKADILVLADALTSESSVFCSGIGGSDPHTCWFVEVGDHPSPCPSCCGASSVLITHWDYAGEPGLWGLRPGVLLAQCNPKKVVDRRVCLAEYLRVRPSLALCFLCERSRRWPWEPVGGVSIIIQTQAIWPFNCRAVPSFYFFGLSETFFGCPRAPSSPAYLRRQLPAGGCSIAAS